MDRLHPEWLQGIVTPARQPKRAAARPVKAGAPWYVARTDDKQRGRLNIISHLLSQVPYKPLAHKDVSLPKRQRAGGYVEPDLPLRYIPTPF